MKNIHKLKVYFSDTDAAGIVYYPNFYKWMDQATHELVEKMYIDPRVLRLEHNIILPLLETGCKHKSPLLDGDIVEVHSQVEEIQNKVITVKHEFFRNNQLVASGYEVRAWTLNKDGKLKAVPVPDEACEAFGHPVHSV
ncbi:acyl-CoA thioesterase [Caldibacillus thermolactis]|jgi:4-hydroxybenzoyl-CoA thioesterase|uniref:Acyl-CoA thioesterase n=1 Tax=Pallidibacillus thermolactis TaxID=251051 RepID=A0ABT2WHR1_9BACI|nr:thioesterase family protein [Pallidibacillus thermolactis]MCU9594496.1 acyl-CoA thioesterase [Pallidibacillus thermolactis]MCU9600967.1 acyl-CoA thioesterase [Pallidibacillus thermolactis subsp. kokeshiiformis]